MVSCFVDFRHLVTIRSFYLFDSVWLNTNFAFNSNFAFHSNVLVRCFKRCSCRNCTVDNIQNISECYCCQELEGCAESMSSELVLQDLAVDKHKLECITAHPGFYSVCLQKWSLRLAAYKYRSVKWGWQAYLTSTVRDICTTVCRSLLSHSTFFVAWLVFVKGTSCCVIRRNFKWNWAIRSCYGKVVQVIGLHDFRCYLHVAAWSLTPL